MEKIAIIGFGCLFPGAETPEQFWKNLMNNTYSISKATKDMFGVDPGILYNKSPYRDIERLSCIENCYIKNFSFNPVDYDIPVDMIRKKDALFQWALYTAAYALKSSGYRGKESINNCGVIIGNLSAPIQASVKSSKRIYDYIYDQFFFRIFDKKPFYPSRYDDISFWDMYPGGGVSTYLSKALQLSGACLTIDAACASSIYSIEIACQYLLNRSSDLMLAGAVCKPNPVSISYAFNSLQLSPINGKSIPFDKGSKGVTLGEGAGMLVLKRYKDAMRDNDTIHAVIESIGTSNDGKGSHFLSPNSINQKIALRHAYQHFSKDIDYLECHTAGSTLGDQIELNTIEDFFKSERKIPHIGCVKSNIGHLLTASGIAGIIKVLLSMKHNIIPATIGIKEPLNSKNGTFGHKQIVTENISWPSRNKFKRAGINSFGFGGTNAHIIIKEPDNRQSLNAIRVAKPDPFVPMAIIGMDAHFGSIENLDSLTEHLISSKNAIKPFPQNRWYGFEKDTNILNHLYSRQTKIPNGAFINKIKFDTIELKLIPADLPRIDQILLLKTANNAINETQIQKNSTKNIAVIIGMETNMQSHRLPYQIVLFHTLRKILKSKNVVLNNKEIEELKKYFKSIWSEPTSPEYTVSLMGNILASRISSVFDFIGPSYTVSSQGNSVFSALEQAQLSLSNNSDIEAVVVGSVDMAGGLENILLRQLSKEKTRIIGEGAGVIVLKRLTDINPETEKIYAVIENLNTWCNSHDMNPIHSIVNNVDYIESAIPLDEYKKTKAYNKSINTGSICDTIGYTYSASGIASIIKTALYLYHNLIPTNEKEIKAKVCNYESDNTLATILLHKSPFKRNPPIHLSPVKKQNFMTTSIPGGTSVFQQSAPKLEHLKRLYKTGRNCDILPATIQSHANIQTIFWKIQSVYNQKLISSFSNFFEKSKPLKSFVPILWNKDDIIEMTTGKISNILGSQFKPIDKYVLRARLPLPPFMFVTRVIHMDAKKGTIKAPAAIKYEYDIPEKNLFVSENRLIEIVPLEAIHGVILLLSFMGSDFSHNGDNVFRLLSSDFTFSKETPSPPEKGATLTCDISIKSLIKAGSAQLVSFSYHCKIGGISYINASVTGGVFNQKSLNNIASKTNSKTAIRSTSQQKEIIPYLTCNKFSFSKADLYAICDGDFKKCFNRKYIPKTSFSFSSRSLLMVDSVDKIVINGGPFGSGELKGSYLIQPDHWAFKAHFKNDPILPGTLLLNGCSQLITFYMLYLGIHKINHSKYYSYLRDKMISVNLLAQVRPIPSMLIYHIKIKSLSQRPPVCIADAEILLNNSFIAIFKNIGIFMN